MSLDKKKINTTGSILSLPLDILNFIVSPFLTQKNICNLKCVCKYLSETDYTKVYLNTPVWMRYYQFKNLNTLTITDTGFGKFLFLELTPLQSLIRFCLLPGDFRDNAIIMCDRVELILPDKIEDMTISLGLNTNLILRHFPKCLKRFDFTSENGQAFHLPKLPKSLKMLFITDNHGHLDRYPEDIIPKWINEQELDLDYFILSGTNANKFSEIKIPRTKIFQNLGDKGVSADEREYVTLNEDTFVAPEVIKELKGEILINSDSIVEKFTSLKTLHCFIKVEEDEFHSLSVSIRHIQDIKFTLIILEGDTEEEETKRIKKYIDTYKEITNLNMCVTRIEPTTVIINGQFINGHLENVEFEDRLLVEIEKEE
jgi:hypothetical protein